MPPEGGEKQMAYEHKSNKGISYYLHSMVVKLKGSGVNQRIFWFATKVGKNSLNDVPSGYKVVTSKRTGLPFLKKS